MVDKEEKCVSNSYSTGGGGHDFENLVQSFFVAYLLMKSSVFCLPECEITKIKLQAGREGYKTDDLVVFAIKEEEVKTTLLGNIKSTVVFDNTNKSLSSFINSALKDFRNDKLFNPETDMIALLVGDLSEIDRNTIPQIFKLARKTVDKEEFFTKLNFKGTIKAKCKDKLKCIKKHIKEANSDRDISCQELYDFLKVLHIFLFDFNLEHSKDQRQIINDLSHNDNDGDYIWLKINNIVTKTNKEGGTLIYNTISKAIKIKKKSAVQSKDKTYFALSSLLGAWNEENQNDLDAIDSIFKPKIEDWQTYSQNLLASGNELISLKNKQWKIVQRKDRFDELKEHIFDNDLENFRRIVHSVLKEENPVFSLPKDQRLGANIIGKKLNHSNNIREGLATSLAIIGNLKNELPNCKDNSLKHLANQSIYDIFSGADWKLWGSLNQLLPLLAESSPEEFLSQVDKALSVRPTPFIELFNQELPGITGQNYLSGLLWALEALAWDKNLLVPVCVILAKLASFDPGGNWANRPFNSLKTILLPWMPQTIATASKRLVAVNTIYKQQPDIGWKLLINLLQSKNSISTGSYRPTVRDTIPSDWNDSVSNKEYWAQISDYADIAIEQSIDDVNKTRDILGIIDYLPKKSVKDILNLLLSNDIEQILEKERQLLWEDLNYLLSKNKRFTNVKDASSNKFMEQLEHATKKYAPSDPLCLNIPLFSDSYIEPNNKDKTYIKQQEAITKKRQEVITKIYNDAGLQSVLTFADRVNSPALVGLALSFINNSDIDKEILPRLLGTVQQYSSGLIDGYVYGSYQNNKWEWVDKLNKKNWDKSQLTSFLLLLPFHKETFEHVEKWLGDNEAEYWKLVLGTLNTSTESLIYSVSKFLKHGKPLIAIDILHRLSIDGEKIDHAQCVAALNSYFSSPIPYNSSDKIHIEGLITLIREDDAVSKDNVMEIEWKFLSIKGYSKRFIPSTLENELASNPEFFCEMVHWRYLIIPTDKDGQVEESEARNLAFKIDAFRLLRDWSTPPGTNSDGTFDEVSFNVWFNKVKEICKQPRDLEVALNEVGLVLIHCNADKDGLWINRAVAEALNSDDAEDMRTGYEIGISNSRGFYGVDPTGESEFKKAEEYRKKAEEVENAGFYRIAITFKNLARSYEYEGKRNISEHEEEQKNNT